ncbi:MAG: tyrosine-type recombinase/integrase [Nitrosotalea sp.]
MQSTESQDQLQDYLNSVFSLSHSENSVKGYRIAVKHFMRFLELKYGCKVIDLVNSIKDGKLDTYRVISEFVIHLDKSGKKPSTIKGWLAAVKGYLRYLGIKIYSEDCKNTVRIPKIRRQREEPMTKELLVRLLRVLPLKLQVAVLVATASGMRLGEIVQLKVSDIDFSSKPTLVKIRADTTKTREARETCLTEETTKTLKDYLTRYFGWKENVTNDDLCNKVIFGRTSAKSEGSELYNHHRKSSAKSNPVFVAENVLSSSLKWHLRKIPEFNKLNENGRRAIHFHAFRKYFRTVVGDAVGRDYAEALMGHHFYLDTYYNLPVDKRRDMYLKAEPYLTISDFVQVEKNLNKIAERQREIQEALAKIGVKFPTVYDKAFVV